MTDFGLDVIGPKILIVDDNPANIMLLEKMLKINNYNNLKTTTDSRQVLDIYKSFEPDLILLDLKMPYFDGFQIMEQLNEFEQNDFLPVIMITAQNERENKIKALDMGVREFVGKPFDQTEVIMRIRNILDIKLLHKKMKNRNQLLEDKVMQGTRDVERVQLELIQRLLRAAEFRDNNTGYHITRIGLYAFELAKLMGMSEEFCNRIMYSSMMHDIGKIGIPDNILLKNGPLNDEEWEIMKEHTTKGALILKGSSSDVIKMAETIALHHHEKWNGCGYPEGLSGENIPLEGRITAICDVFDALLSKRPYKEAWEIEKVSNEIQHCKGSHFDPSIARIFIENIDLFFKIKNDYLEGDL